MQNQAAGISTFEIVQPSRRNLRYVINMFVRFRPQSLKSDAACGAVDLSKPTYRRKSLVGVRTVFRTIHRSRGSDQVSDHEDSRANLFAGKVRSRSFVPSVVSLHRAHTRNVEWAAVILRTPKLRIGRNM